MTSNKIKETLNEKGSFDMLHYSDNVNEQAMYIKQKINECEIKITALKGKEIIINNIITRISNDLDNNVDDKNYKVMNINQQKILSFYETLSIIQEMLIKYEDMIQKYIKMLLDIENNKINAFVKIKNVSKNEKTDDDQYTQLMSAFNEMLSTPKQENAALTDKIKTELKLEGY